MAVEERTIRIGRREFTERGLMVLLSGVAVTIASACGGSSSPTSPSAGGSTSATQVTGSISANHGHVAQIASAQITARDAVTLHIQGTATHDHTVDLTSAEIGQVAGSQRVSKNSSTEDGHNHTVTFN